MMNFSDCLFLLLLLYRLTFTESLRCAVNCDFVGFPLNITVPMSACKHVTSDNAQCSVIVEIDFNKRFVTGSLNIGNRTNIASLRTETRFPLDSTLPISTVWYTCTMSDDCDFEFLNELMTNRLADLDAISIQQRLIDLIYNSTPAPTDIQCTNILCASNNFCQAQVTNVVTWQYNYTYVNESLPCTTMSPMDNLVKINQAFILSGSQMTEMNVRCNKKECNNNKTILDAYKLIQNEFALPVNYSFFNSNISFTTTILPPSRSSILHPLHTLSIFITFVFFVIVFC